MPGKQTLDYALGWLEKNGSRKVRDGMARFAIPSDNAYGVPMNRIQALAREIGTSHALAAELWKSARYEARILAAYVDDPAKVTGAQMDRWCRDFDNWAVVDTLCFKLFDRAPDAWSRVAKWAAAKGEFQKRAAFALLWSLAAHDKAAGDAPFLKALPLLEKAAADDRNFVKKAVNMALRGMGRRGPVVRKAAIAVARRLAESPDPAPRWVGRDALRALSAEARQRHRVGARR